jgi:hypothetical protein
MFEIMSLLQLACLIHLALWELSTSLVPCYILLTSVKYES